MRKRRLISSAAWQGKAKGELPPEAGANPTPKEYHADAVIVNRGKEEWKNASAANGDKCCGNCLLHGGDRLHYQEVEGMSVGENIRKRREALGLSQAALAQNVGVSAAMISFVERGSKNPSLQLSVEIARELACSISDLVQ